MATLALILHVVWVGFILIMIPCIAIGSRRNWVWISQFEIRFIHLGFATFIFLQTVFKIPCPLTLLENTFRSSQGERGYSENGCVIDWFTRITGLQPSAALFDAFYVAMFLGVAFLYWAVPPRSFRRQRKSCG